MAGQLSRRQLSAAGTKGQEVVRIEVAQFGSFGVSESFRWAVHLYTVDSLMSQRRILNSVLKETVWDGTKMKALLLSHMTRPPLWSFYILLVKPQRHENRRTVHCAVVQPEAKVKGAAYMLFMMP